MRERQQASTTHPIPFLMVSSTDHVAGVTGLTPTVTISKDGGSFASPAGAVSEVGNGWYVLAGNATDRNTLGGLLVHATAAGADPMDVQYTVVGYDPFDAARLGLTALPATGTLAVKPAVTLAAGDVTGSLPAAVASIASNAITTTAFNSGGVTIPDARLANLDAAVSSRSTYAGADTAGTTTLLARLTTTRAGYLDNLSAGAVALASQIPTSFTTALFASAGVFSTGALANAPTGGSAPSAATIAAAVRDVSNASPATGSLGAAVNTAAAASGSSGSVVVDGGTVSASPSPSTTGFTATGANLHAPTGGYTIAPMWVLWTGNTSSGVAAANQGIKSLISAHTVTGSGSGASHAFVVGALPVAPATGDQFVVV